ncbi:DUF1214 domain-containing protein [Bdellovibrio bacteriovorus]|uniref:DUF1254 domain-containing protein n=1 Tax=Bdellovibrio bacteriovorus str. Tiberius TaxID=1069642 RepID=K7ZCF5_BDEBC|nr:DUF1214 domain-containing protein [Bdellovibrio bacteriovorus]AFY03184.1 hypothetical protein Bdt_3509 [Bdellovibrio bacteriovorus str. Tiberius]
MWQWSKGVVASVMTVLLLAGSAAGAAEKTERISDKDVVDAYAYYLGRLLVLRQEHLDFRDEGFRWNKIIHRSVGGVKWANPNLDVAYSEAWVGLDKNSCTMLEVPKITGRYYTIQTLNGWGETTSNVNERTFPRHASGKFAYCLKDSTVALGPDVQKVILPSAKSRILARIELGADPSQAVALQKQIKLYSTGTPVIAKPVAIQIFTNKNLPGITAFDNASAVLASEADINPGMEEMQAKVRGIQSAAKGSERTRLNELIRTRAIPDFGAQFLKLGTAGNGWHHPTTVGNYGSDYRARSSVNLGGIWANNSKEAVYYKTNTDGQGADLNGTNVYTMTFPKDRQPQSLVRYFWSVIVVDGEKFQVVPNSLKRYNLNNQSGLKTNADGSLTVVFANKLPSGYPQSNWLPTPAGKNYHLTMRFYGPSADLENGKYFPPPLVKASGSLAKSDRSGSLK